MLDAEIKTDMKNPDFHGGRYGREYRKFKSSVMRGMRSNVENASLYINMVGCDEIDSDPEEKLELLMRLRNEVEQMILGIKFEDHQGSGHYIYPLKESHPRHEPAIDTGYFDERSSFSRFRSELHHIKEYHANAG